jgi:hypothetical protein
LARRVSFGSGACRSFRSVIGAPSETNCSSYFLPWPSVAAQETLDACRVAKFPTSLHVPADDSTDGTGTPSSFGLS